MNEKVYYASNYDNQIHNINDVPHIKIDENSVDILNGHKEDSYVIDQVNIHTLNEIIEILKI